MNLQGATVVVQGYGNAGNIAARLLAGDGAKVLAVSDSQGLRALANRRRVPYLRVKERLP